MPTKLVKLASLMSRPRWAAARIMNILEVRADRSSTPCQLDDVADANDLVRRLGELFPGRHELEVSHEALPLIETHLRERRIQADDPFPKSYSGTPTLGRLCYFVCRLLRPDVVVETGVAYGVTSTYILQALTDNQRGALHSIDLPPLRPHAERYIGRLVPPELRERWQLNLGPAKRLLPEVLQQTKPVDLFVHDSLHTYRHMKWEMETALSALRPGGVLIADDIQGNRAFEEMMQRPEVDSGFAIRQEGKAAFCGVLRIKS